jgi:hypothetical protein
MHYFQGESCGGGAAVNSGVDATRKVNAAFFLLSKPVVWCCIILYAPLGKKKVEKINQKNRPFFIQC